jgi:hypothetical protein
MQRFGRGTRQRLNTSKTVAIAIGPPGRNAAQPINPTQPAAAPPAVTVAHTQAARQVRVVQQATALGLPLVNDWDGTIDLAAGLDWPSRQQLVEERYSRPSKLPLAVSGQRSAAALHPQRMASRGCCIMLTGLPPPDVITANRALQAALISI